MPMSTGWKLTPSSIHGDGDKILLPPSVLAALMTSGEIVGEGATIMGHNGRPIAFRIGVPDPDYAFPASDKMRDMIEDVRRRTSDEEGGAIASTDDDDKDDDDDDDDDVDKARVDELSYRYLTYTHGTVVEFTEEEAVRPDREGRVPTAEDVKVGVCIVQVRGRSSDGNGASSGRRRFDVAARRGPPVRLRVDGAAASTR
ncbi:hypothetical protein ACHAW5_002772 [Stephanodiscus triporus]|uniref:Uncharacterized protein n=1 Tax=Stephanodiscus triporus TaxID=2934178 RepID=A0ABD3MDU1_9STRA